MNRRLLVLLILPLCFLFGCSSSGDTLNQAISARQRWNDANGCSFTCTIDVHYSDRMYTFALECQADPTGAVSFTVSAPESVKGITGIICSDGTDIQFDNMVLSFPPITDKMISPVIAPWLMLNALRSGFISYCDTDKDGFLIGFDDSFHGLQLQTRLWFDGAGKPIGCELIHDGYLVVSIQITNYLYL